MMMKNKENDENLKRRFLVHVDHWAFLEEIEAPMWADLTLEPHMTTEDNDDAWFHTTHSFHHLSARQLRSAFAHPDVGNDFVNFSLQGACSPKLPSSVSKSRGKDYISKPRKNNCALSASKNHPVNDLGNSVSRLDKNLSRDRKPKVCPENQSEVTDSITSVICNDSCATTVSSNSFNSQPACISGVSTTSTVTTLSHSQSRDTKVMGVSKEVAGHTGGLLNALKTNLRRSCATRPALRVEVCDDKELKGRNSSSGKSSVGSSSFGFDEKAEGSVMMTKIDRLEQVKKVTNVNMRPRSQKSVTGMSGIGISNPTLEVKKMAASNKQSKDKQLGSKGSDNLVQPMKGRGTVYKASEQPVRKLAAGLKQKESGNANVWDLGKSVPTVKGRAKAPLAEASDKSRTCHSSRAEAVKSKVLISQNITNRSRLGGPCVKGQLGRAHLNGPCSTKENTKRVALSRISSGNSNLHVVRTSDHKRPAKLTENKASVASVDSKVKKNRQIGG